MAGLHDILQSHVDSGALPGAVALVARDGDVEFAAVGSVDLERSAPMQRDSIFRIASITKPLVSAALMVLVDEGQVALDTDVAEWLPELASPRVVRTPSSPLDDTVPAVRPITVEHLLTSRTGWGFPSDFSLPAVQPLFAELAGGSAILGPVPEPDEWLRRLAGIPLLDQPGDGWFYNTSYDLMGVLIARITGQPLPDFMAERLFEPLGMVDTGFSISPQHLDRFTSAYQSTESGGLEVIDRPEGAWSTPPDFPSGAGGLLSTVDDWRRFADLLLAGGGDILSPGSVKLMTTDHLTAAQRDAGELFLEGQGWGFGGSVDVSQVDPWNVPGRYGWVGGTGTMAHVVPSTGLVTMLLTQVAMSGPTPPSLMREFWAYAAGRPSAE